MSGDDATCVLIIEDDPNIVDLVQSNLLVRGFAVLVSRPIAMPEIDVPARELPDALEAMRVGAPVFARECHVSPVNRDPLFSRKITIPLVDLSE